MTSSRTGAQRNADWRKKGKQIAVVLQDPEAIKQLDKLAARLGGYRRAIEALALASKSTKPSKGS